MIKIFIISLILISILFSQNFDDKNMKDEILKIDSLFASKSLEVGAKKAFEEFLLPSSIQLPDQVKAIFGAEMIVNNFGDYDENFILEWFPKDGEVSECKTMAWTWGIFYVRSKQELQVLRKGKYLNIWRKDKDGNWKVKVDMGNLTQ